MNRSIRTGIVALAGMVALTTGGVVVAQAAVGSTSDPAKREDSTTGVVSTVTDDPTPDPDPTADPAVDPTQNTLNTRASKQTAPAAGGQQGDDPTVNTVQSRTSVASKQSRQSKASAPSRRSAPSAPSRQSAPTRTGN